MPLPLWKAACCFHGIVKKISQYDAQIRSIKGHLFRYKHIAFHVNHFLTGKGIFIVDKRVYDKVPAAGNFIPVNLVVLQYGINLFFGFFEFTGLYGSLQIHQIPVEVMPYPSCLLIGCFPFCRLFVTQSDLLFIGKISLFCFLLSSQFVIYVKGNIVYHDHEYGSYQEEEVPLVLARQVKGIMYDIDRD